MTSSKRSPTLPEYYPTRAEREILTGLQRRHRPAVRRLDPDRAGFGDVRQDDHPDRSPDRGGNAAAVRGIRRGRAHPAQRAGRPRRRPTRSSRSRGSSATSDMHLDRLPDAANRLVAFLGGTIGNLTRRRAGRVPRPCCRTGCGPVRGCCSGSTWSRTRPAWWPPTTTVRASPPPSRRTSWPWSTLRSARTSTWTASTTWPAGSPRPSRSPCRLRARGHQHVTIQSLGLAVDVEDGEEIVTEISAKFRREGITAELVSAGFVPMGWWTDACARLRRHPGPARGTTVGSGSTPPAALVAGQPSLRAGAAATRHRALPGGAGRDRGPGRPAVRRGPDRAVDARRQPHQMAPGPRHVVLRAVRPHARTSPGYRPVDERYLYLWNSYYEGVGPRHPRAERGLLSRPGVGEVTAYRDTIDEAMDDLLGLTAQPAGARPDRAGPAP